MRPALVALLYFAVLAPNLWATLFPFEDWPFTNAPMFAHYVDRETPRYRFVVESVRADGGRKELGYWSVGAQWSLWRYFFKRVYGSADPESIFSAVGPDSAQSFDDRLGRFFAAFVREFRRFNPAEAERLHRIDLSLARLKWEDNSDIERRLVGAYDLGSGKFHRITGSAP